MQKHERLALKVIQEAVDAAGMLASVTRTNRHTIVEISTTEGLRTSFPMPSSPRSDATSSENFARQKVTRAIRLLRERESDGLAVQGEGTVKEN